MNDYDRGFQDGYDSAMQNVIENRLAEQKEADRQNGILATVMVAFLVVAGLICLIGTITLGI